MMHNRTGGLVQPGVLQWERCRLYLRVEEKGRNVGLLVESEDGTRRHFLVVCHPHRLGAVAVEEVRP